MNGHTQLLMQAREAGRQGQPCPVKKGDTSPEGLDCFHAWLIATTQRETGAVIVPGLAESEHPDLLICRPKEERAL